MFSAVVGFVVLLAVGILVVVGVALVVSAVVLDLRFLSLLVLRPLA